MNLPQHGSSRRDSVEPIRHDCEAPKGQGASASDAHRLRLGAYLLALAVPAALAADSARAWLAAEAGNCEKIVAVAGALWVLAALVALAACRDRRRLLTWLSGPLLSLYAVYFLWAALEGGLRLRARVWDHTPFAYQPGTVIVFHIPSARKFGLSPQGKFTVNALGLRGTLPPAGARVYRIIAVGGSTTECAALDDSETWPELLSQELSRSPGGPQVWVGNAGVSGLTAVDHLWCLRYRPILSRAELLIFLVGANDLEAALEFGGKSTERALEERAGDFIRHAPHGLAVTGGEFRRSWVFADLRTSLLDLRAGRLRRQTEINEPVFVEEARRRTAGPVVPAPDLSLGLREYRQRIRALGRACGLRGRRCVFLTQPGLWRADLPPAEQRLLWLGRVGRHGDTVGYAPLPDLARDLQAYNQALLDICAQDRLECYDLASAIPQDTSAFYDDFHFNIGGARLVAAYLAERLRPSGSMNPKGRWPLP